MDEFTKIVHQLQSETKTLIRKLETILMKIMETKPVFIIQSNMFK